MLASAMALSDIANNKKMESIRIKREWEGDDKTNAGTSEEV